MLITVEVMPMEDFTATQALQVSFDNVVHCSTRITSFRLERFYRKVEKLLRTNSQC